MRVEGIDRPEHAAVTMATGDPYLCPRDETRAGAHQTTRRSQPCEDFVRLQQRRLEVLIRQPRRAFVTPHVVGDLVALVEDPTDEFRMLPRARSDQEESSAAAVSRQHFEHLWREGGVRPVVKTQRVCRFLRRGRKDDVRTSSRGDASEYRRHFALSACSDHQRRPPNSAAHISVEP